MESVKKDSKSRETIIENAFREAFNSYIEKRSVDVIVFSNIDVLILGEAIYKYPAILKPLTAMCNIAARSIERDLGIKNIDTYKPRIDRNQALAISGYIKPFLPPYIEIPSLIHVDRIYFIDKEIRTNKGRWEKRITECLNKFSENKFKKRKFKAGGEEFELDAASPEVGPVMFGIDVKRVEARRDIHKRCDEIVNKAAKVKLSYPNAKFAAVIYYPFIDEQINVQNRLRSDSIDAVVFASESDHSIENATRLLLAELGIKK